MKRIDENINEKLKNELDALNIKRHYIIHDFLPPYQNIRMGDLTFNIIFINNKFYTYTVEQGVLYDLNIYNNIQDVKMAYINATTY